jgi:hypothetical protein
MRVKIGCLGLLLLALGGSPWIAPALGDASLSADELARRTVRADVFGWIGAKAQLRMALIKPDGKRSERKMEFISRQQDGLLHSVVRFLDPPDVAGTAVLLRQQKGGASEQYIYLSGLKRTRRIAGRERDGSFMGSDFTYADMEGLDLRKAKNVRQADDKVGDAATYVLESTFPAGGGYGKITTWVRKTDFVALRTRFFDAGGKLLKTLYVRKVRDLEGKPVVIDVRMQNENKHATEIIVDSLERKDDLPDELFTPGALERY